MDSEPRRGDRDREAPERGHPREGAEDRHEAQAPLRRVQGGGEGAHHRRRPREEHQRRGVRLDQDGRHRRDHPRQGHRQRRRRGAALVALRHQGPHGDRPHGPRLHKVPRRQHPQAGLGEEAG